jgi:predicted acylesterase/phospholipase RssA
MFWKAATVNKQNLSPAQIQYLSFEGGGGKGAAYLGALAAFAEEDINILKKVENEKGLVDYALNREKIKGVSGASAGAITATLVACGCTLSELVDFTKNSEMLGKFYDDVDKRQRPHISSNSYENASYDTLPGYGPVSELIKKQAILYQYLLKKMKELLAGKVSDIMLKKLILSVDKYVDNLMLDYGFFSGRFSHQLFDKWIGEKSRIAARRKDPHDHRRYEGITFKEFKRVHEVDLILTGTNLTTGKSQYFSAKNKNTEQFKVSDALRISMSFPIAFKPVIIGEDYPNPNLRGAWIDGGALNNTPIHAFDENPLVINPGMLGMRLGRDPDYVKIESLIDFIGAIFSAITSLAEVGQIRTEQERIQTIELPTEGLSTLDFTPPLPVLGKSIESSADAVLRYFGISKTSKVVREFIRTDYMRRAPIRSRGRWSSLQ